MEMILGSMRLFGTSQTAGGWISLYDVTPDWHRYKLLAKKGAYPRTHSLRSLIRMLGKSFPELLELVQDERKLHYIARLEEAYIVSRYLPYSFEEREVRDIYRFIVEVFKPDVEKV